MGRGGRLPLRVTVLRATNTSELASDRKSRFGLALLVAAVLCLWIAPGALAVTVPDQLSSVPASPANDNNPLIKGTADLGTTVTLYATPNCMPPVAAVGDAADFVSSGLTLDPPVAPLGDDTVTPFSATASDGVGGTSGCSALFTYVEDSTPPAQPTFISTVPASPANDNTPLVKGTAEAGSAVTLYIGPGCSDVVGGFAAAAFASPGILVSVANNTTTTFRATATDVAGNTSPCSSDSITYTDDSIPPETAIDSGPAGLTNDPTPTFTFWGSQSPSFECKVDAGPWFACTTPYTSFALADGPHRFQVRATDPAGNTDQSPATRDFTIDSDLPETTIDAGPAGLTTDASPRFEFSSNDPSSIFECRLDSGDWAACSSPKSYGLLLQGPHTFEVRATDAVGNADPMPAQRNFTVDTRINGSAGAKAAQKQAGKKIVVKANASSGEELDVDATGRIKLGKRSYKLKPKTRRLGPGRSTTLTLRPKKPKHAKKIAKALKRGRKATAKLKVSLTDEAGNTESRRLQVKLRR